MADQIDDASKWLHASTADHVLYMQWLSWHLYDKHMCSVMDSYKVLTSVTQHMYSMTSLALGVVPLVTKSEVVGIVCQQHRTEFCASHKQLVWLLQQFCTSELMILADCIWK